jgi:rhamnose transport system permease protein
MILLSTTVEYFLTPENLLLVLRDQAPVGLLAMGMTLIILTGGIDLSVGSTTALAAMGLGLAWEGTRSAWAAAGAALAVGGCCGALNGWIVSTGRVPPLIVTLATLSVFRGGAFLVGKSSGMGQFSPALLNLSRGDLVGVPIPFCLLVAATAVIGVYLARTDGGRAIYAVGSNREAARLSGVPVGAILFRLYLLNGLFAGLAAILYAARNDRVKPDMGSEYELLAITMTVLGGTSVSGGTGGVVGTALGFSTLVFLQRGITLRGLPAELHGLVVAALLIGALFLDTRLQRRT